MTMNSDKGMSMGRHLSSRGRLRVQDVPRAIATRNVVAAIRSEALEMKNFFLIRESNFAKKI